MDTPIPIPKIVSSVILYLKNNGHKCCKYDETINKLEWCHEDICTSRTSYINKKTLDNASELIKKGHSCILFTGKSPIEIKWCGNEPCSGKNI